MKHDGLALPYCNYINSRRKERLRRVLNYT